ncbi:MAG: type I DNA topoisomerase, partial [Alphaproteobacteria bacterium]|nr:type I DNA topoisomerase [Alphaproteobacteria bacterium]
MSNLVILESPGKIKTISRYLGKDFNIIASYGHIRDLPSKNGSVDPDNTFKMVWDVSARSQKYIDNILKEVKKADTIYLATDPDREGEAISWHILEMLKEKKALKDKKVARVVFSEITKTAVQNAFKNAREVNQDLVDAYMARRALDYLVGFNISPVLWRKLPGSRSAGRVQSVALRLIVRRELEIEAFTKEEYWSITGDFLTPKKESFSARLTHLDGKKLEKFSINSDVLAKEAVATLEKHAYHVASIEKKQVKRNSAAPFITSTLQQEAARKIGFSASRTMQIAQKLYEGITVNGESTGLITYMRTDGVQLAADAVTSIRAHIEKNYGDKYVPTAPIIYKSKAKNAQEAHEAIRPTDISRTPESLRSYLDDTQYKLYDLIWKRTLACQMTQAVFDQVSLDITSADTKHHFKATGSTLVFDGFLRVYQEGLDDAKASDDDERLLPKVNEKEPLDLKTLLPKQHFTEPPPRYSEASLVKKLEELGIGRPSTYASIIQVLQDRDYVFLQKRQFTPNDRGRIVNTFLENYFKRYVEYDFTAKLEEELDEISDGKRNWLKVMEAFWQPFHSTVGEAMTLDITSVIDQLQKDMATYLFGENKDNHCPKCNVGHLGLKLGKFGAFLGCSNYPDCSYTRPLVDDAGHQADGDEGRTKADEPRVIGTDPVTGNTIMVRKGPYGWYLQWENEFEEVKPAPVKLTKTGKVAKSTKKPVAPKPKRVGLQAGTKIESLTVEEAMFFKQLPKPLGIFPDTGEPMDVNIGKFGPYVRVGKIFASIPKAIDFFTINFDQAVDLVQKKIKRGPSTR